MVPICGIAGIVVNPNDVNNIDVRSVCADLLLAIENRGRDATGAAWFSGGNINVQKDALAAREFVPNLEIPTTARNVILHTRFGTKGTERDNDNNHPVCTGKIVGVHNGGIWNDDSLFRDMGITGRRVAEVDTEAVFAAIAYGQEINPSTGKPRLANNILDILGKIRGSAAVAWQQIGDPNVLRVARISSSPLAIAQTKGGSFLFASTLEALDDAAKRNNLNLVYQDMAQEGDYFLVRDGHIHEFLQFKPAGTYTTTWKKDDKKDTPKELGKGEASTDTDDTTVAAKEDSKSTEQDRIGGIHPHAFYYSVLKVLSDKVSEQTLSSHYRVFKKREDNIDKHIAELEAATGQAAFAANAAGESHCYLRVGAWVYTDLGDVKHIKAQVLGMPQTFPDGSYILKAMIPNGRYKDGYEPVLVERQSHEFVAIPKDESPKPETPEN